MSLGTYPGYSAGKAKVGIYPDYSGTLNVGGSVTVTETTAPSIGLDLTFDLTGLEPGAFQFHVHSGKTCKVAANVGGHYFEGLATDPWLVVAETAAADGTAKGKVHIADFSLDGATRPVKDRAIVVHSGGVKVSNASLFLCLV